MGTTERTLKVDDILRVMVARLDTAPREPWTATEIADRFPVSRVTAWKRLEEMQEKDLVDSKKVGSGARVFWLAEDP